MSDNIHWRSDCDTPYLGSHDLVDYKDIIVTIDHVSIEMTEGLKDNDTLRICYFKQAIKPMILNSTNSKTITMLAKTPFVNHWPGQKIQIFVLPGVKAFGEVHDALRIRPFVPQAPKPHMTPEHKLWTATAERIQEGVTLVQIRGHYICTDENFEKLKNLKNE
jgi:hypothetical protein